METTEEEKQISTPLDDLQTQREKILSRRDRFQRLYYSFLGTALLAPLLGIWGALRTYQTSPESPVWIISISYSLIPLALLPFLRVRVRQAEDDIQELDFKIELQQFEVTSREMRAEKILRLNDFQLRRYYNLNISQNSWVFGLGLFCILLGIAVIGVTLFLVVRVAQTLEAQIITAALGSVGAILTNFIAAIYLRMNTAATENLTAFHSRLVETHQLLLGNLLASRIENDEKRWETLSQLSLRLMGKGKVEQKGGT